MGELREGVGGSEVHTMVRTPLLSPSTTLVPGGPMLLLGFSIFLGGEWGREAEDWVVELISGDLEEPGEMSGL